MRAGDRIKFLNDTGGGEIIRFLDPETVLVRIEDGFEVPVKLNQLIPDKSNKTELVQDEIAKPVPVAESEKQEKKSVLSTAGQVYLAFTRERKPNNLKIHLINDSDYNIYFTIGSEKLEQHLHQYAGLLEGNTKIVLGNIRFVKNDEPVIYSIQYMGYKTGYYHSFEPVHSRIEIDTKNLVDGQYEMENDFFEEPASLFSLPERQYNQSGASGIIMHSMADKELLVKKQENLQISKSDKNKTSSDSMEVDLHIHEIVEDNTSLSEGEILDIQLRRFEMALETALNGKLKRVIFIHGVGQGKLKYEITKILSKKYPDLKYQDASFKEYGYGATLVLL